MSSPADGPSETYRWIRRAVAVAVPILAVNTIFTAFADTMPASHHVPALIAAPVFVAAWTLELSGVRWWPRLALIAAIVVPNLWLTLIGHTEANYLFLSLLVGWVAFAGTRAEGLLALALAFGTTSFAILMVIAPNIGSIDFGTWTGWTFSLLLTWFMGLVLRRQEGLVAKLHLLQRQAEQRSQELAMLLTVSRSVASTLEMRPLLDTVFDALGSVLDYSAIGVLTVNDAGDALTLAHARGQNASTSRDVAVTELGPSWETLCRDEPVVSADGTLTWVPLVVRQQIIGVLRIASAVPQGIRPDDAMLALGIARQAAVAIENARLHELARQAAVLEERQRLSRELHDSVTQALYGISLYAEAAGRALSDGDMEPVATNLREIGDTTQEALGEMRLLLFELRPPLLQEHGLAAALRARLQAVETRAGLVAEFQCKTEDRLAPDKEQELYRLAQEALNNVLKHAHAGHVKVQLATANGHVTLDVADDGVGFEPRLQGSGGFGVRGMRERVERLGGTFRIDSSPGAGTRLHVEVPR